MDYGQEIRFGSFITPMNADPAATVELAIASEVAGLDLVTFQDHPYQPRFLDTWTLLSFVAARTTRVTLAPNVSCLPLRPPGVLARAAASLDLLSAGRLELGLGAGAFWEAIEAMGGKKLSPGQSVQALREAIGVLQGIWGRRPARVEGDHYWLRGAKVGPTPAHDIEVWLGAYKPRMLALTGELANGWLPSLGRMSEQDLHDSHARIDDAATAAGRNPSDIRRLANVGGEINPGTVTAWTDHLTALALNHGFSTFIFATDDAGEMGVVGQQIAPAVRLAVASARG